MPSYVRYYHSQYDTGAQLSQDSGYEDVAAHLTQLATTVVRMLYQTSTGSKHNNLHANESLVSTSYNTAAFLPLLLPGCVMFFRLYLHPFQGLLSSSSSSSSLASPVIWSRWYS